MGQTSSHSLFEGGTPLWHELPETQTAERGAARKTNSAGTYEPYMTLYTNLMGDRAKVDDGSRNIFGWRKVNALTGKVGEYEWVTYKQFVDQVADMSAAMVHALGLKRQEPVGIFSKNRYEWVLVEHGSNRMAYQLVPLYDTLGPSAVPYIVNHTEMRVLFVGKQQYATLLKSVGECPSVKIIVQFEDVTPAQVAETAAKGIELKSLKEILEVGKAQPVDADPPLPEDVATICYTSGTTGNPKGALVTHANLVSAGRGAQGLQAILPDDVHISYLPLPHIFERAVQVSVINAGGAIGFYQGDVAKLTEDLGALRPTIFPSVPRVLNRMHDKILQGVEKAGGAKKRLFDQAYADKKYWLTEGFVHHKFWDALVFSKAQQLMGGRMRIIMNASAPISKDCKEFLQIVLGCAVIEGYGLTEAAVVSLSTSAFAPGSHVGLPASQVEVCLHDVPDMNYTSQDKPYPRGEICVRGPQLFKGYFKEPEKTAEVIDADGWFHTGDIGKWNADGTFSIIDRKKNIFKLSQGEYVAPEKIENIYLKSALVAQIFVHGYSLQNYLVGIVIPDKEMVTEWVEKYNGGVHDKAAIEEAIRKDLEEIAVKNGLFRFERIQKLHFDDELWTSENNLLTPTFKIKRPQLLARYGKDIDAMYAAN